MEKTEKKPKTLLQKILDVVMTVFVVLVVIIAVFVLFVTITSKRSADGAINVFGYEFRTILTGSMEKCTHKDPTEECDHVDVSKYDIGHLSVDTMIFIETVPENKTDAQAWYSKIKEGDVLTFMYEGAVITHRVIEKKTLPSGAYEIHLMGDNRGDDGIAGEQIIVTEAGRRDYVIGKVVGQSEFLGWMITTVKKPIGAILFIFVPCGAILIVEVVRIISMLAAEKKRKAKEKADVIALESDNTQKDIEELKRQIELYKQSLNAQSTDSVDTAQEKTDQDEQN